MQKAKPGHAMWRGFWACVALVALALLEYVVSLAMTSGNLGWMTLMNVIDAGIILYFFMHIAQLWHEER